MDIGHPQKVGFCGSRSRTDREAVERAVDGLPAGSMVISGGCHGVDTWAAEAARKRGLGVVEYLPDLAGVRSRGESAGRYYARNQLIVDNSDVLVAFVSDDRKGGTEDTIRRAKRRGIPVIIA